MLKQIVGLSVLFFFFFQHDILHKKTLTKAAALMTQLDEKVDIRILPSIFSVAHSAANSQ